MTKFQQNSFYKNVWWHRNEAGIIIRCLEPERLPGSPDPTDPIDPKPSAPSKVETPITETTIAAAIAKLEAEGGDELSHSIIEPRTRWEPQVFGPEAKVAKVGQYPAQDEAPTSALVAAKQEAERVLGDEDWRWAAGKNPKTFRSPGSSGGFNGPRLVKGFGQSQATHAKTNDILAEAERLRAERQAARDRGEIIEGAM